MGNIKHLGPVEMFECSTCHERYLGVSGEKQTRTWQNNHRKKHWRTGRGVWIWGED